MAGVVGGVLAAGVAYVGAAVVGGIGIEDFFVEAGARDADDVAFADDWGGVEYDDDEVVGGFAVAEKREDAVVAVVAIDPFETVPVEIDFVESGLGSEGVIEVGDEFLNAAVRIPLK